MKKGLKVRAYPSDSQQLQLNQIFGNCRYFWNYSLNLWNETYKSTGIGLTANKVQSLLPELKKAEDTNWLKLAPAHALQIVAKDLGVAFDRYFKGISKKPKFKGKHDRQSLSVSKTDVKVVDRRTIQFAKIGRLEVVFQDDLDLESFSYTTVTLSKNKAGKYYVSFCRDFEPEVLETNNKAIGIDFGLIDFVITSDGDKVEHPKHYQKLENRKKLLDRAFSRTKKGSKNRGKAALRKNKVEEKITNRRKDFQHKLSRRIVNENQVVCIEDLAIRNMMKNSRLSKALAQSAWYQFTKMLEYKCKEAGREFVKVGRFYPSSKICNHCGHKRIEKLTLDVREWECKSCGHRHHRDINAAKNIRDEGLRLLGLDES